MNYWCPCCHHSRSTAPRQHWRCFTHSSSSSIQAYQQPTVRDCTSPSATLARWWRTSQSCLSPGYQASRNRLRPTTKTCSWERSDRRRTGVRVCVCQIFSFHLRLQTVQNIWNNWCISNFIILKKKKKKAFINLFPALCWIFHFCLRNEKPKFVLEGGASRNLTVVNFTDQNYLSRHSFLRELLLVCVTMLNGKT